MTNRRSLLVQAPPELDRRAFLAAACGLCVAACGGPTTSDASADGTVGTDATSSPDASEAREASTSDAIALEASDSPAEAAAMCTGQDVGALTEFAVGSARDVNVPRDDEMGLAPGVVIVVRDARGVGAFSGQCLHFGGIIRVQGGVIQCTQIQPTDHSAQYDRDGVNTRAEAGRPARPELNLKNHKVSVCNGRVIVDRTQEVPRGTRTPV